MHWLKKGGVFPSDKTGVDKTAIDAATAKQFTAGYDALKALATVLSIVCACIPYPLARRIE